MLDRRGVLAILAATLAAPARGAALADQPDLPGPLARYRDLALKRIDGEPSTLGRLLGPPRPSVVSFWATWCAPCALEAWQLARLRTAYSDERLAIVGLNIDTHSDSARLEQFRRKAQMNYTQGLEAQAAYVAIAGQSRAVLPRTYVFDAAGQPVAAFGRFFGSRTLAALTEAVRRVADAAPPGGEAARPKLRLSRR